METPITTYEKIAANVKELGKDALMLAATTLLPKDAHKPIARKIFGDENKTEDFAALTFIGEYCGGGAGTLITLMTGIGPVYLPIVLAAVTYDGLLRVPPLTCGEGDVFGTMVVEVPYQIGKAAYKGGKAVYRGAKGLKNYLSERLRD